MVEVSPYKARKDLLLPGLAVYASPENLDKYSKLMMDESQDDQPSSPFALSVRSHAYVFERAVGQGSVGCHRSSAFGRLAAE